MMRGKSVLKILIGLIVFALLVKLVISLFLEPLVKEKIQSGLNKKSDKYTFTIHKVHFLWFPTGIRIESLSIFTDPSIEKYGDLNGKISNVKISGIHLIKALFRHEYHIDHIIIDQPQLAGRIPFPRHSAPMLSPFNIRIDNTSVNNMSIDLRNTSNSSAYRLKNGNLKMFDIQVMQKDTISQRMIGQLRFETEEVQAVTSDDNYTITGKGITYSALSGTLEIKDFKVVPNHSDSRFMARFLFETDRIEARFKDMYIHDFSAIDYVKKGDIISSFIKIGDMDIKVYRDKRKKFRHTIKPAFQELMYTYDAALKIDSVGIQHGNVVYTEMVDDAKAYGRISFTDIRSSIYNITNDSVYKVKDTYFVLKADGMFMNKSKIRVLLKARLYDKQNIFTMSGHLSDLEVKELNPMLENSAFMVATAGKIDTMNFSFIADNIKSQGKMKLFYHGLAVTVLNKETGDSSGLKQKVISFIANRKLIDANPLPGKEIREGKIEHERDPERFLINYCFRSILSGIRTTLMKNPKEGKKPKDE